MIKFLFIYKIIITFYLASIPALPSRILFPVMIFARVLLVPLMAAMPNNVRFSTWVPNVQVMLLNLLHQEQKDYRNSFLKTKYKVFRYPPNP